MLSFHLLFLHYINYTENKKTSGIFKRGKGESLKMFTTKKCLKTVVRNLDCTFLLRFRSERFISFYSNYTELQQTCTHEEIVSNLFI